MNETVPHAKTGSPREREMIYQLIVQRGLCGLANDTKWNELITAMRARRDWRPSYRIKYIDGLPSMWDVEWFYQLPFPMLGVEWLDVGYLQEVRTHHLPERIEFHDHSEWIEPLLKGIGLDYLKGKDLIRIFGYSPRNMDLFHEH